MIIFETLATMRNQSKCDLMSFHLCSADCRGNQVDRNQLSNINGQRVG